MATSSPHRSCEDFHRTAATARHPTVGVSRRHFLGWGVAGGLTLYTAGALPLQHWVEGAAEAAAAGGDEKILVNVFLPGGLDLLDSLLPTDQYGLYARHRGRLALGESGDLLKGTLLSPHRALRAGQGGGLAGLYDQGKVALLPGIDYANPDLSHFHSRVFWESGTITSALTTGWLGRWLDRNGSPNNPFQGLTSGSRLSPTLLTSAAPVSSVESARATEMKIPAVEDANRRRMMRTYSNLARPLRGDGPGRAAARASARYAQEVSDRLAPFANQGPQPPEPGSDVQHVVTVKGEINGYPQGSEFGANLEQLAFLLDKGLGVRVATVDGRADFDTHNNQAERLAEGLSDHSAALSAFQYDLRRRGLADRVLTFIWTEFGRRPTANSSGGTDHGAGGIAFVMGEHANGGVRTEFPSLRNLDANGNLKVTADFRGVYASLIEQWLGTSADDVIPDAGSFPRVKLVR
jgi:uncharacterized protein (DUF1501 family)